MASKRITAIFWSGLLFVLSGISALISFWLGPDNWQWWSLRCVFSGLFCLSVGLLTLIGIKTWWTKNSAT